MGRGFSPFAVVVSVAVHGGLVALAALGPVHRWPVDLPRITPEDSRSGVVGLVVLAALPAVPARAAGPPAPAERPARAPPAPAPPASAPAPRLASAALLAVSPSVTPAPAGQHLALRASPMRTVTAPPAPRPPDRAKARVRLRAAAAVSQGDQGENGPHQVAELLTWAGQACPSLRRSSRPPASADEIAVAVSFVVDTTGAVDRRTLEVVQSPGWPPTTPEFYPHIYVVGTTARVDRDLPQAARAYGAVLAADVLRHVAALRFRPALRNGRPVRSTVLVSCQAQ